MDVHRPDEFVNPMPMLPPGITVCDGIPRSKWHPRNVLLRNEAGEDFANEVCRNVDPDLVIDMDEKPLGDDQVAVQIAESLCEKEVPCAWMWSMHSLHIKQVFINGVNLYDHNQTNIYNMAVNALHQRVRKGVCSYESSRQRIEPDSLPKKNL